MEMTGGSEATPEATPEAVPEATPSPEETPTPVEEETPTEVTPEEPMLYETPDGRQVTAEVLQKEWKENFLPEFTRKSQALADIEREKNINNAPEEVPEWQKDDYVPQNYAEIINIAEAKALQTIRDNAAAEIQKETDIKNAVEAELTEIKATDSKLDADALFQHANKYGFNNLKQAYSNMSDMKKTAVDTEQRTVKNIKDREVDPISTGPGGEVVDSNDYDPNEMSQYDGANDYLASLKK
jgi:hypothetical protein